MAEIVTGAMGSLLPKLANLIKKEYNQQKKLRGEIMFLETELRSMEAALIKVSEAPIDQPPDMQVKLWTREVRELSYDLEDTIDKFMVRVGDGKPHSFKGFIDRSLDLLTRCTIKHKIGLDIKEIRSRIKDVSEQRNRYKVDLVPSKPVGRSIDSLRLSALDRKATELVGAEEKSVDLVKRLMEGDEASTKQPVVLSIVGFGGLGKTTLANLVYKKIKGQFDCGAFVNVSHNPDMVKIFKDMLYQLDRVEYRYKLETWSEQQLISELREFVQHKRFFIVVDDIWNTYVWEMIQCALMENECGSRIITTTRNLDVAKQAGSVYQMEPLSLTDSTKLFCQRIFGSEDKRPPDNLVEVADKILKKCGGVPLAIITMASMLANKTGKKINTYNYWSNVYRSMGSGLDGSNDVKDMRRILSVSYYDLPWHLKTCLLYLSSFPEDYEIKIKHLIWKWIGEGFVHEEQGKTLYEVGEDYIEELVNRSMIQPVDIGRDGKTVSCLIHDMVHDLISFLSNEEQFLTKVGGQQPISLPKKIRRLSLQISQKEEVNQLAAGTSFSHVRSLIVSGRAFQLMPNISSFLVLRVLDLRGYGGVMNHHFRDICNMFHLRYLNTGRNSITEIPKEIQNLQFLQVLDMSVRRTQRMPSTFIHLRQLLQLRCYGVRLPDGFGKLISLQEVRITIESPSMLCDLGCLTELRTLAIEFCDWDESYGESFIQCLSNLVNLKSMEIKGTMMSSLCSKHDKLYPGPQQLCSIYMESGGSVIITAVPRWMSSLCFLSTIKIGLLTLGEQDIQVLGSIPSLSDLSIYVTKTTQDRDGRLVIGKSYPFQCLTKMSIVYPSMAVVFAPGGMQNLKELHLVFLVKEVLLKFGDCNLGLEHLLSLEHVSISVERTKPKKVEAVEDEIRKALDMNPGKPTWRLTTTSQQYDSQFSVDCSMFECGSFASRSSIRLVHEVVSKFDLQKREVVKSIGFEGILHFPPIKQYNRKFALWLMSCVNEEFSSLVIGQHMNISFTKGDVGHVFGIPSSGKSVLDLTVCSREAKDRVLQTFLGAEFKDHRSIKLVQEVVEREYSVPMTKSETDTFRVAFVVFVVSNLLCPSAKYDYASIDYWNAIQDPDAIITYDWAEYVIVRLLEAVSKLKQDVSSNIKFPNISGCSIFLQVLYLDSLDIPGLAMPHNNFPRIRDFSYEKLRSMILADKNYAKHKSSDVALPAGKLRPKSECIYSWAKDQGSDNDEPRSEWLFAIWESAVAMVHLLNIPLEAAGPVFVAAADFQQQINSGLSITGTQAMKFMSVLVSIMIPYTRGFSYQPSYSLDPALSGFDALESAITNGITLMSSPISHTRKANSDTTHGQCSISTPSNMKHMLSTRSNTSEASTSTQGWATLDHTFIGDHVQRSFNSARSSLDDTPHNLNVNLRVATAMSQFYSLLRRFKPARGFDLNTCVPHEDTSLQSPTLILHSVSGVLPNPWHLGYAWSNDGVKTTRAYDKLNSIEDDDRLAIIHRNPKYIQVSSLALRDQFTGKREFELDLFDALIRAVHQQDDLMYAPFGNLRWRIFFESDFMEAILSGPSDLLHRSLCEHLSLADCTYDLSKTKLMFFPALLQCRWVCFVWSIENNVISVFEPSHGAPVPESRVEAIERSCFLLNLAMHTLSRSVFHGLSHEAMCADMRLLTLSYISAPLCFNRSGALCSFFCRCYDGGDLTPRPSELDADTIAAKLLNEIVDLKDNSGTIPPQLKAESLSASPAR